VLPRNRWFVAAALAYALLGGLLGLTWLAFPAAMPAYALRAHAHLMLLGFIGMMIFGIGLHVLPRFTGRPLFSERLADVQFALVNLGLLAMVTGWLAGARVAVTVGGALSWTGFLLFSLNVVATVRPWARR
jgi:cbb3-type cytochrome oxidase subunit 1